MSNAKMISCRVYTAEEKKMLQLGLGKICARQIFVGGSVMEYDDGSCRATFTLDNAHAATANAQKIGEMIIEKINCVDQVWHDGRIVAYR